MAKKDFSKINAERVYTTIETATAEPAPAPIPRQSRDITPTADQVQLAREQGRTQGRKGCKAIRINMAFTPEIHEYIKTMARVRGQSMSEFTAAVFAQHMEENAAIYDKAKAFKDTF